MKKGEPQRRGRGSTLEPRFATTPMGFIFCRGLFVVAAGVNAEHDTVFIPRKIFHAAENSGLREAVLILRRVDGKEKCSGALREIIPERKRIKRQRLKLGKLEIRERSTGSVTTGLCIHFSGTKNESQKQEKSGAFHYRKVRKGNGHGLKVPQVKLFQP